MKYEEITSIIGTFVGLSIKSSIRKLNCYISDSLLTQCRRGINDFSILVLCAKPMVKKKCLSSTLLGMDSF